MNTVSVTLSKEGERIPLPFISGKFKIRDVRKQDDINYDWYRIYFSFILSKSDNQSKMYEFPFKRRINRAETHYTFKEGIVNNNCIKNFVSLLPTIEASNDINYNPLIFPEITIEIDYNL